MAPAPAATAQVASLLFRRSEAKAGEATAGVSDTEVKRALGLGTVGYLVRPYQVVRSRRLNVPAGHNQPRQPGAGV